MQHPSPLSVVPILPSNLDVQGTTASQCCSHIRGMDGNLGIEIGTQARLAWPAECEWMRALYDFDFDGPDGNQRWLLEIMPLACGMWARVAGDGAALVDEAALVERHGGLADPRRRTTLPGRLEWHLELVSAVLPHVPHQRLVWSQYATVMTQRITCDSFHRKKLGDESTDPERWAPMCGWEAFERDGGCDCLALVAENTRLIFAAAQPRPIGLPEPERPFWAATPPSRAARQANFFRLGGMVFQPNRHAEHLAPLREQGRAAAWSRFVLYNPQHSPAQARVDRNIEFGRKQMRAALRVASRLGSDSPPPSVTALLELAGEARMRVATEFGSEGADHPLGQNVLLRRATAATKTTATPLAGKYLFMWNATLELVDDVDPFFEPPPLAAPASHGGGGPPPRAVSTPRSRVCGTTATHVIVKRERCEAALAEIEGEFGASEGLRASEASLESWGPLTAGVQRDGNLDCRVVLNRVTTRPAYDGLLLGEDCYQWYGYRAMTDLTRLFGMMLHSSPLAIELLLRTQLRDHYAAYLDTVSRLRHAGSSVRVWDTLRVEVASMAWLLWNLVLYARGTLTTVMMLHHAMLVAPLPTAVQREAALLCVPRVRSHTLPDLVAMAVRSAAEWVDGVWWRLWDDDEVAAADLVPCLHRTLQRHQQQGQPQRRKQRYGKGASGGEDGGGGDGGDDDGDADGEGAAGQVYGSDGLSDGSFHRMAFNRPMEDADDEAEGELKEDL